MDKNKLIAAGLALLLAGALLGRLSVPNKFAEGRVGGCQALADALAAQANQPVGLLKCALKGNELHLLVLGQDAANLDAR